MQKTTYAEYKMMLKAFSKLKLFRLNGLELQKLLTVPLKGVSQGNVSKFAHHYLRRILRSVFFSEYRVSIKGKGNIILLFSNCYAHRLDHKERIETLWGYLDDCRLVNYEKKIHRLNIRALTRLMYIPIWFMQIGHRLKRGEKIFIIASLLEALEERDSVVKTIRGLEVSGIIVYCDAHITDNLLVQQYKAKDVPTATLQHGCIAKIDDDSHEYLLTTVTEGFVSDFFLLHGEESKYEAIKSGISSKKLFVVGGLDKEISKYSSKFRRDVFGVVLCVKEMQRHNEELISIANKIGEMYKLKYIIRLHPSITEADIIDTANKEYFIGIEDRTETIDEHVKEVDFSITGKSTMFSQLLQRNHPTFQFIDSGGKGIYSSLGWGSFSTVSQFGLLYKKLLGQKDNYYRELENASEYLVNSVRVEERYREFVKENMQRG